MLTKRSFGLLLFVGGLILLGIAYHQSGSFGDRAKHALTGDFRERTDWMIVAGAIASGLGFLSLVATSGRRSGA